MRLYIGEKLAFARKNARHVRFVLNNGVKWEELAANVWGDFEAKTWAEISYKYNFIKFTNTGNPVQCYPAAGYPLNVTASWEPTQEGSGDPSPDNIRPITGRESVQIQRCGENLFNKNTNVFKSEIEGTTFTVLDTGIRVISSGGSHSRAIFQVLPLAACKGRTLTISYSAVSYDSLDDISVSICTATEKFKNVLTIATAKGKADEKMTFTVPVTATGEYLCMRVYSNNTSVEKAAQVDYINLMLTVGSDAPTEYTPYTGITQTLTLPETIYGGSVGNDGAGKNEWKTLKITGAEVTADAVVQNGRFIYRTRITDNRNNVDLKASTLKALGNWATLTDYSTEFQSGQYCNLIFCVPNMTSKADYQSWFTAHDTQIAYKLAEPTTFTATGGGELTGLDGLNNILTDADSVTVEGKESEKGDNG